MIRHWAFFSKLMVFLLFSPLAIFSQAAHVQVLERTVKTGTFEVRKGSGDVSVKSREFQASIEMSAHKSETLYISMLYDPHTKLFWWHSDSPAASESRKNLGTSPLLPPNSLICLTDSKFVLFWNGPPSSGGFIFVLESAEHYSSMDTGQAQVLHALQDRPEFFYDYKRVQLRGLDKDFLFLKGDTAIRIGPKLKDVKRIGNEWHITEEGPNGSSALIVLNDQYEVVSTTMLPAK